MSTLRLILLTIIVSAVNDSNAQDCLLQITDDSTLYCQSYNNSITICESDTVCLTANAILADPGEFLDFNTNALPVGWTMAGTPTFGAPCAPSLSGTNYYWSSAAGAGIPYLNTPNMDVSCGGYINFEMVMAVQGQAAPCEGPDSVNEGVYLQYTLDGGAVWINLAYYEPDPATGAYTSWECFSVPIPPGAMSTYTMFQWIQTGSSGADFDNWGLDNIVLDINCAPPIVNWSTGASTFSICDNPTSTQSYVASVYNGQGAISVEQDGNIFCLNCIFNGNVADTGAAIAIVDDGSIELYNSTLVQNWATLTAGALYLPIGVGTATIYNSIIYDNTSQAGVQSIDADPSQLSVLFTLSDTPIPGTGNMLTDPLFMDPDGADDIAGNLDDDFHLQVSSPVIDYGNSSLVPLDAHDRNSNGDSTEYFPYDLDGFPRNMNISVDMGAYEVAFFGVEQMTQSEVQLGYIFPNPTDRNCAFEIELNKESLVEISLIDMRGTLLETVMNKPIPAGTTVIPLVVEQFSPGSYLMLVKLNNKTFFKKLVIK